MAPVDSDGFEQEMKKDWCSDRAQALMGRWGEGNASTQREAIPKT